MSKSAKVKLNEWDKVKLFFKQKKEEGVATLGAYALEKFGKSKYARQQLSTVPTSLIAGALKSIFNFLVLYRLATGNAYIDFLVSLVTTVVLAAVSPVFYYMAKEREADIVAFSNHFADHLMLHGMGYLLMWRGRTVALGGAIAILFLLCYDVDSWYLIRVIVEMLLSFWIVDQVNLFRDSIFKPVPLPCKEEFVPKARPHVLGPQDFFRVPVQTPKYTVVMDNVIENYQKPLKLHFFRTRDELCEYLREEKLKARRAKIGGHSRVIVDDWVHVQSSKKEQEKRQGQK